MTTEEPFVVLCPREAEILERGGPAADALHELIRAANRMAADLDIDGKLQRDRVKAIRRRAGLEA